MLRQKTLRLQTWPVGNRRRSQWRFISTVRVQAQHPERRVAVQQITHNVAQMRAPGQLHGQRELLVQEIQHLGYTACEPPVFHRLPPPSPRALEALIQSISQRIGAFLEREGLLVRDIENSYLQLESPDDSALNDLLGHSITYRIAVGPQAGRKAFTLQTVPAREQENDNPNLAKTAGFSLHAGVAAKAHQRRKLERLCRYVARPAVATDRLALTPQGNVRYTLKTPYRDGTTHIILEPLDFIARLAALVPKPRVNLTRFHGVFAPSCPPFGCNSALRHHVTPASRGQRKPIDAKTPAQRRAAMTGFCSCKAGIHALHGNNLGTAPQARIQDRYRNLRTVRRYGQGDCLMKWTHPSSKPASWEPRW